MPVLLPSTPSFHSLALPRTKQVPFVLPRRHSSAEKASPHSATAELVSRLPPRRSTMGSVVRESCSTTMTTMTSHIPSSPSLSKPPPSPRPSPRRCNSDPNSSTIIKPGTGGGGGGGGEDVPISNFCRRQPRRCNSEPKCRVHKISRLEEEESPSSSPASIRKKFQARRSSTTLSESSSSEASLNSCDVLRAYQEAVDFQEKLREDYQTSKRVFILFRYQRLRSLIREATVEQHLEHLRQAIRGRCSCGGDGVLKGSEGGEEKGGCVRAVVGMMRPAFNKVRAYLQTALQFVAPTLLMSSTPSLHKLSSSSNSPSHSCPSPEHEWQRSRLALLERHLERLKRECLSSERSSLPLSKYKIMKNNLKNVLDARMV